MSQTISNDYVSMINKKGSGYNIPVIVDAIVDASITPVKNIVTSQKEKVDASISGMGTLKSSVLATQTLINTMSSGSYYTVKNSHNNHLRSSVIDQSALEARTYTITMPNLSGTDNDGQLAEPMVWSMEKGNDVNLALTNQEITFTFGNIDTSNNTLNPASGRTETVTFSGDTLTSAVAKINEISGVQAKLVKLTPTSEYSVVLTSDTGSQNSFKMTSSINGHWQTGGSGSIGTFTQDSSDARFTVDGQTYTRASNVITDVIPGLQIELLQVRTGIQTVTVAKSAANIQKTVETLIGDLNAYKTDLDTLGFIDEVGNEDGDLAHSSYLRNSKRQLTNLMTSPITGFGDNNIYFVDFGIKTGIDGSYVFDQATFNRTYANEPEKFNALTDDKSYTTNSGSSVYSVSTAGLPAGKYSYTQSDQKIISAVTGAQITTNVSGSGSNYTRSTSDYPGFSLSTLTANPSDYEFYIGHSAKTKIDNFLTNILSSTGNYKITVDLYANKSTRLEDRLDKIDQRELLLQSRYTKQFTAMETVVTDASSSKDFITQMVDSWNKS
jgi:flagellar hook-associated protein 2